MAGEWVRNGPIKPNHIYEFALAISTDDASSSTFQSQIEALVSADVAADPSLFAPGTWGTLYAVWTNPDADKSGVPVLWISLVWAKTPPYDVAAYVGRLVRWLQQVRPATYPMSPGAGAFYDTSLKQSVMLPAAWYHSELAHPPHPAADGTTRPGLLPPLPGTRAPFSLPWWAWALVAVAVALLSWYHRYALAFLALALPWAYVILRNSVLWALVAEFV